MRILGLTTYVFCLVLMLACGMEDPLRKETAQGEITSDSGSESDSRFVSFTGYVVNAAGEVTVDGVSYGDLEVFYTSELERLPNKIKAKGWPGVDESFTTIKFDASIGFHDLYQNMTVYTVASGSNGYQGSTSIDRDGRFSFTLPRDADGDSFKLRATKRISVKLSSPTLSKTFCYNFSAVDKDVRFVDKDKPIILSSFQTSYTAYACAQEQTSSGMEIPQAKP